MVWPLKYYQPMTLSSLMCAAVLPLGTSGDCGRLEFTALRKWTVISTPRTLRCVWHRPLKPIGHQVRVLMSQLCVNKGHVVGNTRLLERHFLSTPFICGHSPPTLVWDSSYWRQLGIQAGLMPTPPIEIAYFGIVRLPPLQFRTVPQSVSPYAFGAMKGLRFEHSQAHTHKEQAT